VSLKQYILNTKEKTVQIVKRPELVAISRPEKAEREKDARSDKESVNRQQELARNMNGRRQSLGEKVIEGLNVKGEIHSWTIPTGLSAMMGRLRSRLRPGTRPISTQK
jgi:hypothetical protein